MSSSRSRPRRPRPAAAGGRAPGRARRWEFRLYVAGQSARSMAARATLEKLCEEHLAGRYRIDVLDVAADPTLARGDQIVAVPTLVRKRPLPEKKVVGDLSNAERVLVGLSLRPGAKRDA